MSNLKINDKKIKDVLKRGIVLTAIVSTLVMCSGCIKETKCDDITCESYENDNSEAYVKTAVIDGQLTTLYRGKNLALAINKETYEVKKYILHNEDVSKKIDNLKQGYIVAAGFIVTSSSDYNVSSTKIILDDNYVVEFANINNYMEGHVLKEYYTLDEIEELEIIIVEYVKKNNGYENSKQKQKSLG